MNTPHKHAEVIKAWADGASIEYLHRYNHRWMDVCDNRPEWLTDIEYRVKVIPHKWQHLIDAQATGKMCQMRNIRGTEWVNGIWDFDNCKAEYRLKPDVTVYRAFLWRPINGTPCVCVCSINEHSKEDRTKWLGFIRWIGDWQEVEL